MTATKAEAARVPPAREKRRPGPAAARLLRLELRHSAMPWLLPVAVVLFWLTTYRKAIALPPLWNVRAETMQSGIVLDFILPVVGSAAWMGSRESRRRTADLVGVTARPRWIRLLAMWAAATCWAVAGGLGCIAVGYVVTAHEARWGGPLLWPATVALASLPAMAALGLAAGTLLPSRFTAPLTAITAFFVLALSTELITGSQSYWQVSPLVSWPWDTGADPGVATFYHYLPDLPIAQVMLLAGLTVAVLAALVLCRGSASRSARAAAACVTAAGVIAAGSGVTLAGTGRLDSHGMIAIPALHDAADDQAASYLPVCSRGVIPVCLNPAYEIYLPATAAALEPVLAEIAGLPGAPARLSQAAARYQQGTGNSVIVSMQGPPVTGTPPVYHFVLPDQLLGPTLTVAELAARVRSQTTPAILAAFVGAGPRASVSQRALWRGLLMTTRLVPKAVLQAADQPAPSEPARCKRTRCPGLTGTPQPFASLMPGPAGYRAALRFAALPAPVRLAWLTQHLVALRAGQITLAELP